MIPGVKVVYEALGATFAFASLLSKRCNRQAISDRPTSLFFGAATALVGWCARTRASLRCGGTMTCLLIRRGPNGHLDVHRTQVQSDPIAILIEQMKAPRHLATITQLNCVASFLMTYDPPQLGFAVFKEAHQARRCLILSAQARRPDGEMKVDIAQCSHRHPGRARRADVPVADR